MVKCTIINVLKNNLYVLKSEGEIYRLILEFYNMKNPSLGDEILISKKLLDEKWKGYTQPYAFEKISEYRDTKELNEEFLVLENCDQKILAKRIYG